MAWKPYHLFPFKSLLEKSSGGPLLLSFHKINVGDTGISGINRSNALVCISSDDRDTMLTEFFLDHLLISSSIPMRKSALQTFLCYQNGVFVFYDHDMQGAPEEDTAYLASIAASASNSALASFCSYSANYRICQKKGLRVLCLGCISHL